jgi:hypothetical protein
MSETLRRMRDLRRLPPFGSQFLLSGNNRDRYPIGAQGGAPLVLPIAAYLSCELARAGLSRVIAFGPISGFLLPSALERCLLRLAAAARPGPACEKGTRGPDKQPRCGLVAG